MPPFTTLKTMTYKCLHFNLKQSHFNASVFICNLTTCVMSHVKLTFIWLIGLRCHENYVINLKQSPFNPSVFICNITTCVMYHLKLTFIWLIGLRCHENYAHKCECRRGPVGTRTREGSFVDDTNDEGLGLWISLPSLKSGYVGYFYIDVC